jgi:hypothetical protein
VRLICCPSRPLPILSRHALVAAAHCLPRVEPRGGGRSCPGARRQSLTQHRGRIPRPILAARIRVANSNPDPPNAVLRRSTAKFGHSMEITLPTTLPMLAFPVISPAHRRASRTKFLSRLTARPASKSGLVQKSVLSVLCDSVAIRSFFSSTYELLFPQALSFHNHLRCRGLRAAALARDGGPHFCVSAFAEEESRITTPVFSKGRGLFALSFQQNVRWFRFFSTAYSLFFADHGGGPSCTQDRSRDRIEPQCLILSA